MTITYDFYRTPTPNNVKGNTCIKYHARVVGGRSLDMNILARRICQRCSLTEADVYAAILELHRELVNELCEGNRLAIPGIGYFSLTLHTSQDYQPQIPHHPQVRIKHVEFRADQSLKDELNERANFKRASEKKHSQHITPDEMNEVLTAYFKRNTFLRRCDMEKICGFTASMAKRSLKHLVQTGMLINTNTPHYPLYMPVKGHFGS